MGTKHVLVCDTCGRRLSVAIGVRDTICGVWTTTDPPRPLGCTGRLHAAQSIKEEAHGQRHPAHA